jgi:hypothetical protein
VKQLFIQSVAVLLASDRRRPLPWPPLDAARRPLAAPERRPPQSELKAAARCSGSPGFSLQLTTLQGCNSSARSRPAASHHQSADRAQGGSQVGEAAGASAASSRVRLNMGRGLLGGRWMGRGRWRRSAGGEWRLSRPDFEGGGARETDGDSIGRISRVEERRRCSVGMLWI